MDREGMKIKKGEDFSDVPIPELVNELRLRYGHWEYHRKSVTARFKLSGISISGLMELLEANGFFKLESNSTAIVQINNSVVSMASIQVIQEFMADRIRSMSEDGIAFEFEGEPITSSKRDLNDTYLRQYHLSINEKQLGHLGILPLKILRDNRDTGYVAYKNCVVAATKDGLDCIQYSDLINTCVWSDQISSRQFHQVHDRLECDFIKFLQNISNHNPERYAAIKSAIGYLMHGYSSPSQSPSVIFYDESITDIDSPQGGTGKGVAAAAFMQIRQLKKLDGKRFCPNDRFGYQTITPTTQIIWFDDVHRSFDFEALYSSITDGLTIEKKNQAAFVIAPEFSPKFLICSNSILPCEGSSNRRRQFVIEFSDHYSKQLITGCEEPIKSEHGRVFFDREAWDEREWNMFDNFMVSCIQYYLQNGLRPYESINVSSNRLAQVTNEDFYTWVTEKNFEPEVKYETKTLFTEFKDLYYGEDAKFSQRTFTNWMKKFAKSKGWTHIISRTNSTQTFSFKGVKAVQF
jgi:hypothetical protein